MKRLQPPDPIWSDNCSKLAVTIFASAAVAPKGVHSTQTADGASGAIPFASVLSSAELLTPSQTETVPARLADTLKSLSDALRNVVASLVSSSSPQSASGTTPVTDFQMEVNTRKIAANSIRLVGKKQRRSNAEASCLVSAAIPIPPQLKVLALNLPAGGQMFSALGSPIGSPPAPNAPSVSVLAAKQESEGALSRAALEAQSSASKEDVSKSGTPEVSRDVDIFGHLSFLLKLVGPARPGVGPKDPLIHLVPKQTTLEANGVATELSDAQQGTAERLAETAIPLPASSNSWEPPPLGVQDSPGSISIPAPMVNSSKVLATVAPGPGPQPQLTQSSRASAQNPLPGPSQFSTAPLTVSAGQGRKSFGDQPGSGKSAYEDFANQEATHRGANLVAKTEEVTNEDTRVSLNSGRPDSFTSPLEGSPQQSGQSVTEGSGKGIGPQLAAQRSPNLPSLTQPPPATAASQIAIRLDSGGESGQVELRIRERAGEVQIAVRSTDQGVATTLRRDLGELVKRLDTHTTNTEVLRQDASPTGPGAHQVRNLPGSDSSRGYSYFSDDAQQRQRQQQQQQDRQRATQPEAVDEALQELRSVFNDLKNGVLSS